MTTPEADLKHLAQDESVNKRHAVLAAYFPAFEKLKNKIDVQNTALEEEENSFSVTFGATHNNGWWIQLRYLQISDELDLHAFAWYSNEESGINPFWVNEIVVSEHTNMFDESETRITKWGVGDSVNIDELLLRAYQKASSYTYDNLPSIGTVSIVSPWPSENQGSTGQSTTLQLN